MTTPQASSEPCGECEKIRLEKQLDAEEAVRAHERDGAKLAQEHQDLLAKLQTEHELSLDSAEDAALTDLQSARWQSEADLSKLFHTTIAEVAKGAIDRSRDGAKYVQTASAGIVALYSGLLALVFSVTDHPLPVRGVYAAVFLGLSVALATAYLAFITKPPPPPLYKGGASLAEMQLSRTGFLTRWVNASIHHRRWAIRASVISLGMGVAFIPAAFVANSRPATIPPTPVAPTIPSQVAPDVSTDAANLFKSQVRSYEAATTARNKAIEDAATKATTDADADTDANRIALALAIIAVLAILVGPWIMGRASND